MGALGEATVEIRATLDKLDGDLSSARNKIEGALGGLQKGLQGVGNIALGGVVAGIAALGAGLGIALNEAMDAQAIMAQTEAVIKSTGGAAGMSAKQIGDLATALSTQSRFSDDAIQTGENLLLTFTNIGKDTFPAATQAMVDMAAAMGTDVSGGAIQLGKALNDPVAGISALSRVGVTFTEDQKKVIKALVATGDVAGAQAVILAELNKEFGGSAAAAAETFAGKMDVVKNQLLNVAEGIGMVLLPILSGLIDSVIGPAIPIIERLAEGFGVAFELLASGEEDIAGASDAFAEFANDVLPGSADAIRAVGESLQNASDVITGTIIPAVQGFAAQVAPYLEMAAQWLASNVSLQDVLIALGIAIAAVVIPAIASVVAAAAPVIIAFVAVIAVAALLRHAWEENWGGIQEKTAAVVGWLTATISTALANIQAWWAANGDAILAKAAATWEGIKAAVSAGITAAMAIITAVVGAIVAFWAENGDAILAKASAIWNTIQAVVGAAITTVAAIITAVVSGIQSFWAAHGEAIMAIAASIWSNIQTNITNAINTISAVITTVANGIKAFWNAWGGTIMSVASLAWENIKTVIRTAMNVISSVIEAISKAIKGDWRGFGEALRTAWDTAWEGIKTVLRNAWTALVTIVGNLISSVKGVFTETDWGAIGKAIIDGIAAGLRNAAGFLGDAARAAAQAALDAAKGLLGIHSPSKVFEVVGANMMKGLAQGITRNAMLGAEAMSGALMPVMGLVGEDGGGADRSIHYSSVTHVNTNRDPMRVLRASRHLDKLGAMA